MLKEKQQEKEGLAYFQEAFVRLIVVNKSSGLCVGDNIASNCDTENVQRLEQLKVVYDSLPSMNSFVTQFPAECKHISTVQTRH